MTKSRAPAPTPGGWGDRIQEEPDEPALSDTDYVTLLERIAEIVREETRTTSDGTIHNSTDVAKAILTRIPFRTSAAPHDPRDDLLAFAQASLERLTERCEAYKGQVEAGAAEIARLKAALAKTELPTHAVPSAEGKSP